MSQPPTAEAIAQAVAVVKKLAKDADNLAFYAGAEAAAATDKHTRDNKRAAADAAAKRADALKLLLTLVADYVPAQDREQAWMLLSAPVDGDTHEAIMARRLLKLPAREDVT